VALDDVEYCVTCPKCGKVIQKAFSTDSFIKCSRCGFDYYTYINEGVAISVDTSKFGEVKSRKTIMLYAREFKRLKTENKDNN